MFVFSTIHQVEPSYPIVHLGQTKVEVVNLTLQSIKENFEDLESSDKKTLRKVKTLLKQGDSKFPEILDLLEDVGFYSTLVEF